MLSNSITGSYPNSPASCRLPFYHVCRFLENTNTIKRWIISRYPSMVMVCQVLFLRDRHRHKDRFSDRIATKRDVDREQFRNRLYHGFIDRIRNSLSKSINDNDGINSRRERLVRELIAGHEAKQAERKNCYDVPDFHSRVHPVITSDMSASLPFSTLLIPATIRIICSRLFILIGSSAWIPA